MFKPFLSFFSFGVLAMRGRLMEVRAAYERALAAT